MWLGNGRHPSGSVDGEVLAELRAIRSQLQTMSDRLALAASREDLDGYVTKEMFDAHVASSVRAADVLRGWLPIALASLALCWAVLGPYVHFGAR